MKELLKPLKQSDIINDTNVTELLCEPNVMGCYGCNGNTCYDDSADSERNDEILF